MDGILDTPVTVITTVGLCGLVAVLLYLSLVQVKFAICVGCCQSQDQSFTVTMTTSSQLSSHYSTLTSQPCTQHRRYAETSWHVRQHDAEADRSVSPRPLTQLCTAHCQNGVDGGV